MPRKKTYRVKWGDREFTRTTANIYTHMLVARESENQSWKSLCFCGNIDRAKTQYAKWRHNHKTWEIKIIEVPQPTDVPVYKANDQ